MVEVAVPSVVEVIHQQKPVQSVVEVKVSKTDVLDMMIIEEEDRLDAIVEAAQARHKEIQDKVDGYQERLLKEMEDIARGKYREILPAMTKAFGEPNVDSSGSNHIDLPSKKKNCRSRYISVPSGVEFKFAKTGDYDEDSKARLTMKFSIAEVKKLQAFKDFEKHSIELEEAAIALNEAVRERDGLEKKGRRAKAQVVRQLLESTEEGRVIMSSVLGARQVLVAGRVAKKKEDEQAKKPKRKK